MDIVKRFCFVLADDVGHDRFETWMGRIAFQIRGTSLWVRAANAFELDRVRRMFLLNFRRTMTRIVREQAEDLVGEPDLAIHFEVDTALGIDPPDVTAGAANSKKFVAHPTTPGTEAVSPSVPAFVAGEATGVGLSPGTSAAWDGSQTGNGLHSKSSARRGQKFRSFESLIAGKCNQLALASAEVVLTNPGETSPLIVHGPHGVGKTHLLESIWRRARQSDRRAKILFLTAEQYTTLFLDALKGGGLSAFRRKYRHADWLIIDDIQFFAGKHATLTEFAYTVDEIQTNGRQLVLSADQQPSLLTALGDEIVARLSGGLPCRMDPLDPPTQESLLRTWAAERQMTIPESIIQRIGARCGGDARQLSGVLNRLNVTSKALGRSIDHAMADEILYELIPQTISLVALSDIEQVVCRTFGVTREILRSDARSQTVSRPRMLAMWLARKFTSAGLTEISEFFGRKSHSTVVSAEKTVGGWMEQGILIRQGNQMRDVRDLVRDLEGNLRAG